MAGFAESTQSPVGVTVTSPPAGFLMTASITTVSPGSRK